MKMQMKMALVLGAMSAGALADTITVGPNFVDYDYITITAAIANAASGDEILIAPGLYAENLSVVDKDLALRNAGGGTVTVFGQDLNKCFVSSGTTTDVVLEGIVFTRGFSTSAGAGVSIEGGSRATIIDCVIEDSHSEFVGGGLYMSGGGTVMNTIIRNNVSDGNGGGIDLRGTLAKSFVNCLIEGNTGVEGGGLSYSTTGNIASFDGCTFRGNTATSRGGAIALLGIAGNSGAAIIDVNKCVFSMNHAQSAGGAIWISDQDVFRALNSVFELNTAEFVGGVVRNEQVFDAVNCTFVNNDVIAAGVSDSFESNRADADTNLMNCVVVNASAASHIGAGDFNVTFSLIPEAPTGEADSNGNFSGDPMFVDLVGGDYTLMAGSAAIDAGNSRGVLGPVDVLDVDTDFNGDVRNLDDPDTENTGLSTWELCVDLGAFEFQPSGGADCAADLTGDGVLNFFDVSAFLSAYNAGCP
jgi:predicted outer membrane repeat protein